MQKSYHITIARYPRCRMAEQLHPLEIGGLCSSAHLDKIEESVANLFARFPALPVRIELGTCPAVDGGEW